MKKKRSAKQLANDKRLGRMAKASAKLRRKKTGRKRTVGRKKTTYRKKRRKNTLRSRQTAIQRATNPKRTNRYVLAALVKNQLKYFDGVRFGSTLGNAAQLPLSAAKTLAGKANRKVVIAPTTANAQKIVELLRGKA